MNITSNNINNKIKEEDEISLKKIVNENQKKKNEGTLEEIEN
jgi:hypothetical protein